MPHNVKYLQTMSRIGTNLRHSSTMVGADYSNENRDQIWRVALADSNLYNAPMTLTSGLS